MWTILYWVYFANAILLILHEIDSGYWQEWKLFRMPGGITLFLLLHVPLLYFLLNGLVQISKQDSSGLIYSLIFGIIGIGAFVIHSTFILKGHKEFKVPVSIIILILIVVLSSIQIGLTLRF